MAVFWVVAPCSLVEVYWRFRDPCCLHHQGDSSRFIALMTVAVSTYNNNNNNNNNNAALLF
jgi:hypothetical protein